MLNPVVQTLGVYPFARLIDEKKRREAAGQRIIDFGMGDPREVTPSFIREALVAGIPQVSTYPTVRGSAELRGAIADWLERRFGVTLDPEREILPTQGSKEGIFHAPLAFIDPTSARNTVVICQPAYPVYESGALYAGAKVHALQLTEANGFLPDLESVSEEVWQRTALFWLNYPHNPTGHVASADLYRLALALAARWGFILCVDECYVDLYFGEAPRSALEVGRVNLLVFHSLSKRSAMTGFRSGFVAGDVRHIGTLARMRPTIGCAMPEFVQAASIAAWNDDRHTGDMRALYRAKRDLLLPALVAAGLADAGGDSTFYLWLRLPEGQSDTALAEKLLEAGVMVCPGSYLGMPATPAYIRFALVPNLEQCRDAFEILKNPDGWLPR